MNYARDAGLDLAVRGGGHSAPGFGTCDGGVVLDLSLINNLFVDPAKKIASGAAPPTTLTTCSTSTRTSPRRADARSASPHRYPIDAPPAAVPAARRNVRRTAATRREAAIQFPWRDAMWPIRRRKRPLLIYAPWLEARRSSARSVRLPQPRRRSALWSRPGWTSPA
ncbi:MAG: FAD-dependent oxidoreductase [Actinomycetota bacterium]|nr:FAD-dependent oxidoreductase [Actinomycetota bacterium]